MNIFGKKAGGGDVEADKVKKSITLSVATSLKAFQQQYAYAQDQPIYSDETANCLCQAIEAVFLHGLKVSLSSSVSSKISQFLASSASNTIPQLSFWDFVCKYTHKDVIGQLSRLGQITTETGMCRAWVRIALNDCVLESYIDAMLADETPLKYYYSKFSYLRDSEQVGIFKTFLQGLSIFKLQLSYNSCQLNSWTVGSMTLSGWLTPQETPHAVLGTSAGSPSLSAHSSSQSSPIKVEHKPSRRHKKPLSSSSSSSSEGAASNPTLNAADKTQKPIVSKTLPACAEHQSCSPINVHELRSETARDMAANVKAKSSFNEKREDEVASSVDSYGSHISHPDFVDSRVETFGDETEKSSRRDSDVYPVRSTDTTETNVLTELGNWVLGGFNKTPALMPVLPNVSATPVVGSLSGLSDISDSVFTSRKDSLDVLNTSTKTVTCDYVDECDDEKYVVKRNEEEESNHMERNLGNSLGVMSGWSSSFEPESDCLVTEHSSVEENLPVEQSVEREFSFDSLLRNYTSTSVKNSGTSLQEMIHDLSRDGKLENSESTLASEISNVDSFEILSVDTALTTSKADARIEELLGLVCVICHEKGLDKQSYQCMGCQRPIGIIYGKSRVCTYDGAYYCNECHCDDEYYIPSRILYNWDFRKRKVSVTCKEFLVKIQHEPVIDVDKFNVRLYSHVPEMEEVRVLRQQLRFLKAYLFTCSQPVADEFRKKIWPKEYLFEDVRLYSLSDLLHVHSGQLTDHLHKIVKYASRHVYDCSLCRQKGFICEICDSPKVIYPFEMDSTTQCSKCKSVFHKPCKKDSTSCPKCKRLQQRLAIAPEIVDYAFMPEG